MTTQAHILVVDDIAENIQVAMNILKEDNYSFSFAMRGVEAIELIEKESKKPDLILLDIMMPGLNGFEVSRKLKENPETRDIPVIFLTARVDIDSISEGFSLGAVDYINKPFHAEELQARVKTHIELSQAKSMLKRNNLALETKVKFEQRRLLSELEENQKEMIYMLTELIESTSDETGNHIKRISEIAALIASYHPSLDDEDIDILLHATPLHDIGKMTIPYNILHKPGLYTPEEFEIMKAHTNNAYNLLQHSDRKIIKAAAIIAHEHHEKWDGTGYPQKHKGTDIHIYGRIVALADVFDALTHNRCYKKAWDLESVKAYIKDQRGRQFDPELVDIFLEHFEEFQDILQLKTHG